MTTISDSMLDSMTAQVADMRAQMKAELDVMIGKPADWEAQKESSGDSLADQGAINALQSEADTMVEKANKLLGDVQHMLDNAGQLDEESRGELDHVRDQANQMKDAAEQTQKEIANALPDANGKKRLPASKVSALINTMHQINIEAGDEITELDKVAVHVQAHKAEMAEKAAAASHVKPTAVASKSTKKPCAGKVKAACTAPGLVKTAQHDTHTGWMGATWHGIEETAEKTKHYFGDVTHSVIAGISGLAAEAADWEPVRETRAFLAHPITSTKVAVAKMAKIVGDTADAVVVKPVKNFVHAGHQMLNHAGDKVHQVIERFTHGPAKKTAIAHVQAKGSAHASVAHAHQQVKGMHWPSLTLEDAWEFVSQSLPGHHPSVNPLIHDH